jgi:adenylosuccinate lyase
MEHLDALSPLDGRYHKSAAPLSQFFSERAYFHYRAIVEIKYLLAFLEGTNEVNLSVKDKKYLEEIVNISDRDFAAIKKLERTTHHDIKALEYFIKGKINNNALLPFIHFGLTSEDINNIAYGLMLSDALEKILVPALDKIERDLMHFSDRYQSSPILARTHGQPASPTTFGKEMRVFQNRLQKKISKIKTHQLGAKLNGATGNYNALVSAYPQVDWVTFSARFINSFNENRLIKLQPNLLTTQVEPHDALVELFDMLRGANNILVDLCRDMWRYISDGWLQQEMISGEVGSSTMPYKINPIQFENAEGNLGFANAILNFFSQKLSISRLQRDLSDSTVKRNMGVSFGHCLLAYTSISNGLTRISLNEEKCIQEINRNPQIITEAIQMILKREGNSDAYESLLELSRGEQLTHSDIESFINQLEISEEIRAELRSITPETYIGLAHKLK